MKEKSIRFYAPEVRATLAGTKTQTRRVVKPQPFATLDARSGFAMPSKSQRGWAGEWIDVTSCNIDALSPYGQPGDRLWVRETWAQFGQWAIYRATSDYRPPGAGMWRPSIHMPRWASRITLEITGVRVERLQDISEADAIAEGIEPASVPGRYRIYGRGTDGADMDMPRISYRSLWESINGPGSWDANPWVWVVEFKRAAALTQPEGGA